jgi:hypothetical protein
LALSPKAVLSISHVSDAIFLEFDAIVNANASFQPSENHRSHLTHTTLNTL